MDESNLSIGRVKNHITILKKIAKDDNIRNTVQPNIMVKGAVGFFRNVVSRALRIPNV